MYLRKHPRWPREYSTHPFQIADMFQSTFEASRVSFLSDRVRRGSPRWFPMLMPPMSAISYNDFFECNLRQASYISAPGERQINKEYSSFGQRVTDSSLRINTDHLSLNTFVGAAEAHNESAAIGADRQQANDPSRDPKYRNRIHYDIDFQDKLELEICPVLQVFKETNES